MERQNVRHPGRQAGLVNAMDWGRKKDKMEAENGRSDARTLRTDWLETGVAVRSIAALAAAAAVAGMLTGKMRAREDHTAGKASVRGNKKAEAEEALQNGNN